MRAYLRVAADAPVRRARNIVVCGASLDIEVHIRVVVSEAERIRLLGRLFQCLRADFPLFTEHLGTDLALTLRFYRGTVGPCAALSRLAKSEMNPRLFLRRLPVLRRLSLIVLGLYT